MFKHLKHNLLLFLLLVGLSPTIAQTSPPQGTTASTKQASTPALPKTGVTGVVLDAQTGETLPFVQVYFVGTSIGTTSDLDGNFSLINEQGLVTITFQYVGYKREKEIDINLYNLRKKVRRI